MIVDTNEAIRYWGVMGLLMLAAQGAPAVPDLVRVMQNDPSPQVRIVAAQALGGLDQSQKAVGVLSDYVGDEAAPIPVRLQAINALTWMRASGRDALPALRKAAKFDNEYLPSAANYLIQQLEGTYDPHKPVFDVQRMLRELRRGAIG